MIWEKEKQSPALQRNFLKFSERIPKMKTGLHIFHTVEMKRIIIQSLVYLKIVAQDFVTNDFAITDLLFSFWVMRKLTQCSS